MEQHVVVTNRKAFHDYHILDKYEAGMELLGSEVKSLREGNANIKEAYGAEVAIIPHPEGGSPVVLPVFNSYPQTK